MELYRTEGIVLRMTPFRDYDQIVTLLTEGAGILSLFCRASRSRRSSIGNCLPLTCVEVVYTLGKGELALCREMVQLDVYPEIRQNLAYLNLACAMLKAIESSQLPGKSLALLYRLLNGYLKHLPLVDHPEVLLVSFYLKILVHDGLIAYPFLCSECHSPLWEEGYSVHSEFYCKTHKSVQAVEWSEDELETIYHMAQARTYQELVLQPIGEKLQIKITDFFQLRLGI